MKRAILSLMVLVSVGCSNQWREADAGLDGAEVLAMLDEAAQAGTASTGGSNALALKDNPSVAIYFADAPGPLGPVASVLSFVDFSFLGLGPEVWYGSIANARVFFLDAPTDQGREAGLIIGIAQGDGSSFTYYSFSGTADIGEGEYVAELTGASGTIVVRSYDTEGDDLAGVIQLKVWQIDGSGGEVYIGKFSTLVGYGG